MTVSDLHPVSLLYPVLHLSSTFHEDDVTKWNYGWDKERANKQRIIVIKTRDSLTHFQLG